jgi:hypothetical protein
MVSKACLYPSSVLTCSELSQCNRRKNISHRCFETEFSKKLWKKQETHKMLMWQPAGN